MALLDSVNFNASKANNSNSKNANAKKTPTTHQKMTSLA